MGKQRGNDAMNDNDNTTDRPVYIIIGKGYRKKGGTSEGIHVLLTAADDDSAVRRTLDALAQEGFAEADLDQIGTFTDAPDEEPHASAYQDALEGEIAIITVGSE